MYSDSCEVPVPAEDDLSRLTKRALDIVIRNNSVELKDSLNLRKTSKSLKKSVDKTLYFHTTVLYRILRKELTDGFSKTKVAERLPVCFRAIINEGKQGLKPYLREFFELMLDNLVGHPKIVCLLVQIAKKISLKPIDFQELGQEVVTLFEFLTKPIQNKEKENEDKILNCIVELKKNGYTKKQCENLEVSIRETFKFLRYDGNFGKGFIYKNLSVASLKGANFEGANLCGANLKKANLTIASLAGANLEGADLEAAELKAADLTGANLFSANLSTATISGDCSGEKAILIKVNFSEANLFKVNLMGLVLDKTNLSGARLSCANLSGAFLKDSNLSGAKLRFARATDVKFVGVDLREADLSYATLTGACFERANFEGAEFQEAEFYIPYLKVKDFIDDIKESIKLNPAGILPLLLAMGKNELDEQRVAQLKKLSQECLKSLLEKISTVEELNKLFSQISVKDNVFCTEIYPDVLTLIANTYLSRNLSCETAETENNFRTKLIEEINKQKNSLSFHNDGWNELLNKINKTELKSSRSFNSRPRANQM
ncbi:MAG: pentapeptide repeat-containing protein [Gammaproteobacteria bacterium]|nr:pentapeptide repeat-containing protein [Gammaproteobacteria bacterium]